jgi:hypothetical protein
MRAATLALFAGLVLAGCSSTTHVAAISPQVNGEPTGQSVTPPYTSSSPELPSESPSPSLPTMPLPSPVAVPDSPPPVGTPVAAQVLPPATVLPVVPLCGTPIQLYQDGNAGPLVCADGGIVVAAWTYFGPIDPNTLSVGPSPTVTTVEAAMCADLVLHATNPMVEIDYKLAAAYYGWHLSFDLLGFLMYGTCH